MYRNIKESFSRKFGLWKIDISEHELFLGNKKIIPTKDWHLSWIMQENEKGPYVEYYGIHNKGEHLHGRIYQNGAEEELDVLREYIAYSPNVPGDREKRTREFESYNQRVMRELKQKGLLS